MEGENGTGNLGNLRWEEVKRMSRIKKFLITMHKPLLLQVTVNGLISESTEFLQVLVEAINFARAGRGTADILLRKPGVHKDKDMHDSIESFVGCILRSISAGVANDDEVMKCVVSEIESEGVAGSCLADLVQIAITCDR